MRVMATSRRRNVQTEADVSRCLSFFCIVIMTFRLCKTAYKRIFLIVNSATSVTLHFSFNSSLQYLFKFYFIFFFIIFYNPVCVCTA